MQTTQPTLELQWSKLRVMKSVPDSVVQFLVKHPLPFFEISARFSG